MAEFRRRRLTRGQKVVIAAALIPALAFPMWLFGGSYLRGRDAAISRAREATIEGPPCPSLTRAQFDARGLKAPKATLYEGVTFARRVGHMDCSILRYGGGWSTKGYPVCQFTGPAALRIRTDKGEWWFDTGIGQPATVSTAHGQARCVLASNFTITGELRP